MKTLGFYSIFMVFILLVSACSPIKNSKYSEYLSTRYEVPECNTNFTYTSAVTLTGSAKFYKRGVNLVTQIVSSVVQLKNMTLGDPLLNAIPIRYAELAVYNSANQIVQCGVTDSSGDLKAIDGTSSLKIPAQAGSFTVRVFSRTNKTLTFASKPDFKMNVAVKQDIYTNELFHVGNSVQADGVNDQALTILAYARQTDSMGVEGGAFNILNSIITAYEYVQNNTGTVNTTCLNEKLNVYWKLGFNPFQYVYPDKNPSTLAAGSYYDKPTKSVFIAGGKLSNITSEVTNHFDDYVIIHELAHHIENVCGSLLSPGGSHYIITRIDPRLAWAEGWANYFAAQVMYNSIDTLNPEFRQKMTTAGFTDTDWTYLFASEGFSDSLQNIGSGSGFMFDLKKSGNDPDIWQVGDYAGQPFDKVNPASYPGEGHFREGAITRGLFKLSNLCDGECISANKIDFQYFWRSMDKLTGLGQSQYVFKSSAHFMELLKSHVDTFLSPGLTWAGNYRTFNEDTKSEALHVHSDGAFTSGGITRWMPYGTYLNNRVFGTCSGITYYIEPRTDDPVLTGTNSDQRYSNHYYTLDLNTLSAVTDLSVTFTKITPTGTTTDFDIILYEDLDKNYVAVDDYSCVSTNSSGTCTSYQATRSTNSYTVRSDRRPGAFTTKIIRDLHLLPKNKKYLLNIRAYTANKSINTSTDYSYTVTDQTGATLCP